MGSGEDLARSLGDCLHTGQAKPRLAGHPARAPRAGVHAQEQKGRATRQAMRLSHRERSRRRKGRPLSTGRRHLVGHSHSRCTGINTFWSERAFVLPSRSDAAPRFPAVAATSASRECGKSWRHFKYSLTDATQPASEGREHTPCARRPTAARARQAEPLRTDYGPWKLRRLRAASFNNGTCYFKEYGQVYFQHRHRSSLTRPLKPDQCAQRKD